MYQVLLVDDEPLILSGIKFLIDWGKNDCKIMDTARNGLQALEKIRARRPDIVICDISMPVMSGSDLLERAAEEFPEIVFIMMTNHPDFHLVQHSLRHRAVDYLLKGELDAETLERSLAVAREKAADHARMTRVGLVDDYLENNYQALLRDALLGLVGARPDAEVERAALAEHGVLNGCAAVMLSVSSEQSNTDLLDWVWEICEETASQLFPMHAMVSPDTPQGGRLFLVCWKLPAEGWQDSFQAYAQKAASACSAAAQTDLCVMVTDRFDGEEGISACRAQLGEMGDHYYLHGSGPLFYSELPEPDWKDLALDGLSGRLSTEIRGKNADACALLLDKTIERVYTVPHRRDQALWVCGEVYHAISGLTRDEEEEGEVISGDMERLTTRAQVLDWLERTKNELIRRMSGAAADGHTLLLERARQYVRDNVESRIMLQDIADHVGISPGYLSALFKKRYGRNLVDYINEAKMARACQLIESGQYRIYEISFMLGFENAYYFARVFKRYIGMTPTEYQKRVFRQRSS